MEAKLPSSWLALLPTLMQTEPWRTLSRYCPVLWGHVEGVFWEGAK